MTLAPRLMSVTLKKYNLSGTYLSSEPPLLVHGLQHDINNANFSLISREKKSDNSQHSSSSMQEFQLSAIIWKHFYLSQKQHAIFRSRWYSPLSLVVSMHWSMYMSIYLPLNLRKWMANGLLNVCFKVVLQGFHGYFWSQSWDCYLIGGRWYLAAMSGLYVQIIQTMAFIQIMAILTPRRSLEDQLEPPCMFLPITSLLQYRFCKMV